jgi:UDP-2-acetamido-2-deoxy-ribo-hexuluronate aminotransferase
LHNGIPTAVHYPLPLNKQPAVADANVKLPIGDTVAKRVVSLPIHPYLTILNQKEISMAIEQFVNKNEF